MMSYACHVLRDIFDDVGRLAPRPTTGMETGELWQRYTFEL